MKKALLIFLILFSVIFVSCDSIGVNQKVEEKVKETIDAYNTQTASIADLVKKVETQAVMTYAAEQLLLTPTITPAPIFTATPTKSDLPSISAQQGWQPTGYLVTASQVITISVAGGEWTSQKGVVPYNMGVGGSPYVCANYIAASKCVEPLPTSQAGILICKVGTDIFEIGEKNTVTATEDGELMCRINDGDDGLYDNDGSLEISMVVQP